MDNHLPTPPRVLLIDDHPAVRQGLALLLSDEGISVCAEAASRTEALALASLHHPHLAIVDLSLDREDGMPLISELQQLRIPSLVYSMHHDAWHVRAAFTAGALGYVTKQEFDDILLTAIREIAARRRFLSPKAALALAEGLPDPLAILSHHERQVFELLGHGEGPTEIAALLNISTRTVESYYERIKLKLNLNSMHELRRSAIEHVQHHPRE